MKIVRYAFAALATMVCNGAKADCDYPRMADRVHEAVDSFVAEACKRGPTLYEGIVTMHFPEGILYYKTLNVRVLLEDAFQLCFDEPRQIDTVFDILFNVEDMDPTMGPVYHKTPPDDKYKRIDDEINRDFVRLSKRRPLSDRVWEWLGYRTEYPFIGDIHFDSATQHTVVADRCSKVPSRTQCIFD